MRDSSAAEQHNLPTAVLITEGVAGIAEATRCLTGLELATIVPMRVILFGKSRAEIAELTTPYADDLLAALGLGLVRRA